jgi:3',5'-cyclic AMP phosphodiesterase CpdA
MKRLLAGALALSLVLAAVALSGNQKPAGPGDMQVALEERNPWTNLRVNNSPEMFHFAIVSDRTGGHRARIFSHAVDQLNLLQPAFVLSVGDLIEGYTQDREKLDAEWKEFQSYVGKLQMPFFYTPGNHDVANTTQDAIWKERFGRRYFHFAYKDVLFLCLNSDDPFEKGSMGRISQDQIDWLQRTLKENDRARWTIVTLHKPLWNYAEPEKTGWLEVEKALAGRPYTVFCGHVHRYQKWVRHGMNYYQLATTGGSSKVRGLPYGEFDHIIWVTMKKDGPVLANIMLEGIYPENLTRSYSDEDGYVRKNMKTTYPVRGTLLLDGSPIPYARVAFYALESMGKKEKDGTDKKKAVYMADALAEPDGTFTLTTYVARDGAPAGEYAVVVTMREPLADFQARPVPNRLPPRYARAETTPLRVQVRSEANELTLNLTK